MDASVATGSVWGLVLQSDFVSKVVLLTLFVMSVLSWAVALYKIILFRIKTQQLKHALDDLKNCAHMQDVLQVAQKHHKTLPGYVLVQLLADIKQAKDIGSVDMLQAYSDQVLDEVMHQEEAYTPLLAVTSSVATLLGLFGTVWGLVHSFIRISEKQSADIVTVAPGIAEALITTVAGLLVAVPALVFLHYISNNTKSLEYQLVTLTDKVTNFARISMVKSPSKDVADGVDVVMPDQKSL